MLKMLRRCALLFLALIPVASVADPIKLKMAYFSSDREPPYVSVLRPFADAVNSAAKDVIEIEPHPGGALGRSYAQQAQLVLDGTADMAWVNPGLTSERFPEQAVMEFPGLFRSSGEATLAYTRLVLASVVSLLSLKSTKFDLLAFSPHR